MRAGCADAGQLNREIARASADIESRLVRPERDMPDGESAPAAIQTERHDPVHGVVYAGNAPKHAANIDGFAARRLEACAQLWLRCPQCLLLVHGFCPIYFSSGCGPPQNPQAVPARRARARMGTPAARRARVTNTGGPTPSLLRWLG